MPTSDEHIRLFAGKLLNRRYENMAPRRLAEEALRDAGLADAFAIGNMPANDYIITINAHFLSLLALYNQLSWMINTEWSITQDGWVHFIPPAKRSAWSLYDVPR